MSLLSHLAGLASVVLLAPAAGAQDVGRGRDVRPNLLVIVADDVGVDVLSAYGEHPVPAQTPVLDRLARNGVVFRNAWVNPKCSPTRASILTGKYPFRTGIGEVINYAFSTIDPGVPLDPAFALAPEQITLPSLLAEAGYTCAAIGKWHLATGEGDLQGFRHAPLAGFHLHIGTMQNDTYTGWLRNIATPVSDVQVASFGQYSPSANIDDTLAFVDRVGDAPWFVWLAFNSAHKPWHVPPADLLSQETARAVAADNSPPVLYRAMVEAMDTEIGRLLAGLPPGSLERTVVVVIGDNGTPAPATTPPSTLPAKGSLKKGGVAVPLIVAGAGIAAPGREVHALVNGTDLHATLLELARARQPEGTDSVSMVPYLLDPAAISRRSHVFAESFRPNGRSAYNAHGRAIRDARYKLVRNVLSGSSALFDLAVDPDEQSNLMGAGMPPLTRGQQAAFSQLDEALAVVVAN